ncbi:MAG: SigE family RNA polymerase sigma factor [Nocardioidaceae bacterium]|nr:MAG: SigE family RNA polymerase sigma factor [Nocardioidaceae bacterium]
MPGATGDESADAVDALPAASFEDFVNARRRALWRSAWLLTNDDHKAEDLVQTALAKAWPRFERISRDGSFEAYVRKIMYTTYLSWWRRRWNGELPGPVPESAALEPAVELRHDLLSSLASLPKGQRAVVLLRYVEDLTEAQTAQLLGISVGTVKSQTSRALKTLRASESLSSLMEDS